MKIAPSKHTEQLITTPLGNNDTLTETAYLLRSPANVEHLNKSIAQFKMNKISRKELINE